MSSSTLIEVFGHIVFSFTRGVTEHYNPEEPEFTAESFGYDPLQSTGREWHYLPVDELIYQEFTDREATSVYSLSSSRLNVRVIDACSPEENDETQEDQQDEDRAMAWKRLRPSALRTVCKSMYIGALISLLAATAIGLVYMIFSYLSYKTKLNCQLQPEKSIPIRLQWMKTVFSVLFGAFYYIWYFVNMLFLFRSYQLMGVKRKLFLVCCLGYFLDAIYRLALQALRISHSKFSTLQKIPLNVLFLISICWQVYLLINHLGIRSRRRKVTLFLQMSVPSWSLSFLALTVAYFIYPAYNEQQNPQGRMIIALFAPLIGVALKAISRICVQRLWNITHPGYSYVLLTPL